VPEHFRVRLDKEYHVFSAAHFITYGDNVCERLHGHNYRVAVEVAGPLDQNQYVVDFIALRDTLKQVTDSLDHYVLLPTDHPTIQVEVGETEVTATFEDRRWVFPRGDCVLLPVRNTTAEEVARYIARALTDAWQTKYPTPLQLISVAVDENHGQLGVWIAEPGVH
jgi:6-pyruvoyltetrahydropterin/6-carboxytetrahydropterin synthase